MALAASGCDSRSHADAPPRVRRIVAARPTRGDIERTITLPGDLVGYYQSALYSKVTGYLKSISVDKGDWVKSGQVLAIIEVPELDQQLARSRADLNVEKLTYQRLEQVWKSDPRLVARQDVDIAYGKYAEAKANSDELEALVGYTKITAPFAGMITERFVDPGALIHAGGQQGANSLMQGGVRPGGSASPVLSIARLDKLRIYIYMPQGEVYWVHQGMAAAVTVHGLKGTRFIGTVARFAHSLDLSTRTMLTEVDLENPQYKLYPGMYANVTLLLERHRGALRVPATAVGGSHRVFIIRHGRLASVPVTTGINDGGYLEVTSGLSGSDLVVQNFSGSLEDGEKAESEKPSMPMPSLASVK